MTIYQWDRFFWRLFNEKFYRTAKHFTNLINCWFSFYLEAIKCSGDIWYMDWFAIVSPEKSVIMLQVCYKRYKCYVQHVLLLGNIRQKACNFFGFKFRFWNFKPMSEMTNPPPIISFSDNHIPLIRNVGSHNKKAEKTF